jgi:ribosomal protein S18 acetylase RimI-like enzyme
LKTHLDCTIECRQLSDEFLEETLSLMEKVYFSEEKIVRAFSLTQDSQTMFEERQVMKDIIEDGVSGIAIDKNNNNKVIGACLNKIHVKPGSREDTFYGKIAKSTNSSAMKSVTEFDDYAIRTFFEVCQVDCVLEITMISILPEYRNRGIARMLYQIVIDLGRVLAKGVNSKKSLDGRELALEPVPETILFVCTSEKAWQVVEDIGFKLVATLDCDKFKCEEKTLADVMQIKESQIKLASFKLR